MTFSRINKYCIEIPPLRERSDEIGPLAEHFAKVYGKRFLNKEIVLSGDAIEILKRYHWPGNVRELEGVIERGILSLSTDVKGKREDNILHASHIELSMVRENHIGVTKLDSFISSLDNLPSYKEYLQAHKRSYFEELLKHTEGNRSEAARIAGMTERGLRKIIKEIESNNDVHR